MKVGCHTAKVSAALFKTNRITVLKTGLNHNNTHFQFQFSFMIWSFPPPARRPASFTPDT